MDGSRLSKDRCSRSFAISSIKARQHKKAEKFKVEPFYFGAPDRGQFGIYHPPAGMPKDEGVVLCPPFFGEYLRAHGCLRRVAIALAETGMPVLRFDYRGTGDSAGNFEETTPDDWRADIESALSELQDLSGVGRVRLLGVRLGATLAAQVAMESKAVSSLVLWDPIVEGDAYVEQLEETHRRLVETHASSHPSRKAELGHELVGFRVSRVLLQKLRDLSLPELSSLTSSRKRSIRLVLGAQGSGYADLVSNGQKNGASVQYLNISCNWATHSEAVLSPHAILGALVSEV
jgi:uncharacterized protein